MHVCASAMHIFVDCSFICAFLSFDSDLHHFVIMCSMYEHCIWFWFLSWFCEHMHCMWWCDDSFSVDFLSQLLFFFCVLVCNSLSHISVHFSKSPEFFFWLVSLHLVLLKDEIRRLATFPFWNFCLHCVGFTAKFNLIFKLKITCHG